MSQGFLWKPLEMRAYVIMGIFIMLQSKAIIKTDIATSQGFCLVGFFMINKVLWHW